MCWRIITDKLPEGKFGSPSIKELFSLGLENNSDVAEVLVVVVNDTEETCSSSTLELTVSSSWGEDDNTGGIGVAGLRVKSLSAFQTLGCDVISHGGLGFKVVVESDAKIENLPKL